MSYLMCLVRVVIVIQTVAANKKELWPQTMKVKVAQRKSAGSDIGGTATWGKIDKTPTLGQFTGNPGGETNSIEPNASV
jgi:uncharacterized membrane protein